MRFYIENGISVTSASRFGRVKSFADCNQTCDANHLYPFQLHDFYNFADSLNQTNFLLYKNATISTDGQVNPTYEAKMREKRQKRDKIELCTDVQYDFGRRKWSDGKALESSDFILQWKKKFQQLWESYERFWPPEPYQPELVVLNYEVFKYKEKLTMSKESFGLSQAQQLDELFYKCLGRNDIREGIYNDALKDCENSNSSFQTYLNEVGFENELRRLYTSSLKIRTPKNPDFWVFAKQGFS